MRTFAQRAALVAAILLAGAAMYLAGAFYVQPVHGQPVHGQPVAPAADGADNGGAPGCATIALVEEAVAAADAFIAHDLAGADAVAWLAAWDAAPPPTHTPGDRVIIVDKAGVPTVLVVVLTAGCVSVVIEEDRGFAERITDAVLGAPAG